MVMGSVLWGFGEFCMSLLVPALCLKTKMKWRMEASCDGLVASPGCPPPPVTAGIDSNPAWGLSSTICTWWDGPPVPLSPNIIHDLDPPLSAVSKPTTTNSNIHIRAGRRHREPESFIHFESSEEPVEMEELQQKLQYFKLPVDSSKWFSPPLKVYFI